MRIRVPHSSPSSSSSYSSSLHDTTPPSSSASSAASSSTLPIPPSQLEDASKDEEKKKDQPNKFLFTLLAFLTAILYSNFNYYRTLEGGETEQWLHARLYKMAYWMVLSDIFFVVSILLSLHLEDGKWRKITILYSGVSMLLLFALDRGSTVQHHGAYVNPLFHSSFIHSFIHSLCKLPSSLSHFLLYVVTLVNCSIWPNKQVGPN